MVSLVLPSIKYLQSFVAAVREFHADGNKNAEYYGELDPDTLLDSQAFLAFVQKLHDTIKGKNIPDGYVAATEFWIITERGEYAGRVHIRHTLTDYLYKYGGHIGYNVRPSLRRQGIGSQALALGLDEARKMGLQKVLITCDNDNEASRKIIEKNGGEFENLSTDGDILKRRYWITL